MKKIVMTLGVIIAAGAAFAQGPYATFGLGYAGSSNGEMLGSTVTTVGADVTSTSINGTFGAGIPIHLSGGYMLNKHVGVELGLTYFMGSEITIDEETSDAAFGVLESITKTKHSSLRISPMLVLTTGGEKLSLYSKLGLIIPATGKTAFTQSASVNLGGGTQKVEVEGETVGKSSMGYTAAIGVSFPISDNLSVFGELHMVNLRIRANTRTLTLATVDGVDNLPEMDKQDKVTEYVDEVVPTDNTDVNQPLKELGSSSNYNSFGINIGIKMSF
jgi:opacity protein-like surface antigen